MGPPSFATQHQYDQGIMCASYWLEANSTPQSRTQKRNVELQGSMNSTDIKDFEAALAELDAIVKKLEEGDLTLENSLSLYERGVALSRYCHAQLENVERRIELLNERGELKPAPSSLAGSDDPERKPGR